MDDGWTPHIVEIVGRFADASNATLLAHTDTDERVIYKPIAGEQPLWDFPYETLAIREVLTYEIASTWYSSYVASRYAISFQ